MKVILTAFGGRLRSKPMDWPDNAGPMIRMSLDMDGHHYIDLDGKDKGVTPDLAVIGVFESNNLSEHGRDGVSARIYVLVGVE